MIEKWKLKVIIKRHLLLFFIGSTLILFLAGLINVCIEICLLDIKTIDSVITIGADIFKNTMGLYINVIKYFLIVYSLIVGLDILVAICIKRNKEEEIDYDGYFRDINEKYSPAISSYILDFRVESSKDILATILHLATKKYLKLDRKNETLNIETTTKNIENLFQHEQYLINCIKENKKIQLVEFVKCVYDDCEKANLIKNEKQPVLGLILVIWWITAGMILGNINVIYAIIVTILFIWILRAISTETRTKEGKKLAREVKGLKNYLKDYTLIKDKDIDYMQLTGAYVPYALALDVAEKIENTQLEYNKLIKQYIE